MRHRLIGMIRRRPALLDALRQARVAVLGRLPGAAARPASTIAPIDWRKAAPGLPVPPPLLLDDIPVVPARRLHHEVLSDGGPVWPDFDTTPVVRHLIHDTPADINATPARRPGPRLDRPVIWGGRCLFHFGHLAAEHLNRLPGALYHHPGAEALFLLPPGKLGREVPGYFWDMTAWFGLRPDRVRLVTRPLVAARLMVTPQAEHMSAHPPPDWHLDLLDQLPGLHGLEPVPNRALYVTRMGQLPRGSGAHAGEAALVEALRAAGVAIMDPGREGLMRQMALYAGARLLIFAEGSAMHGRQLLGRVDQTILVLRRRPHSTMARAQLQPRCTRLDYAPVIRGFAAPIHLGGSEMLPHGITFLAPQRLFGILRGYGVELAPHWDGDRFAAAEARDAQLWRDAILARSDIDRVATLDRMSAVLTRMGVA